MPETQTTKDTMPDLKNLQSANATMRGLYVRGDCILVLESEGANA